MLRLTFWLSLLGSLLAGCSAYGQAVPAATLNTLQIGVGISHGTADEWVPPVKDTSVGLTFYATLDVFNHLGPEADVHFQTLSTPHGFVQDTYLLGPRYTIHKGRFEPYGKVLGGFGHASVSGGTYVPNTPGTFFTIAFGGGLDFRVTPTVDVRGDFEYQDWLTFGPNGLTPTVTTVGVAYRFY
jgi:opacity protein-like surface antigen